MNPGPDTTYDRGEMLDRIMITFWEKGYSATSVRELRHATGLGSRSLYADFGDKKTLFRTALSRYRERSILPLYEPLDRGSSPLAALHYFIDRFEALSPSERRLGCLVGIGMAEIDSAADPDVADDVAALADEMRHRLIRALTAAVEAGELDPDIDPTEIGALLTSTLQGAHLAGRLQPTGPLRSDTLRAAHHILDRLAARPPATIQENR